NGVKADGGKAHGGRGEEARRRRHHQHQKRERAIGREDQENRHTISLFGQSLHWKDVYGQRLCRSSKIFTTSTLVDRCRKRPSGSDGYGSSFVIPGRAARCWPGMTGRGTAQFAPTQLPWNPSGTRWPRCTRATGPDSTSVALKTARSLRL